MGHISLLDRCTHARLRPHINTFDYRSVDSGDYIPMRHIDSTANII